MSDLHTVCSKTGQGRLSYFFCLLLLSRLVVSNFLGPRGLQHARLPVLCHVPEPAQTKLMSVESVMPSNHLVLCFTNSRKIETEGAWLMMSQPPSDIFSPHHHEGYLTTWLGSSRGHPSNYISSVVKRQSPTFLVCGTSFVIVFPWTGGKRDGFGLIHVYHGYHELYFYYYYVRESTLTEAAHLGQAPQ